MLINSLPDPAIAFTAERPWLENNIVLHARSAGKYHYPEHATPYMVVANPNGRGKYMVNQRLLPLSGKSFLFLAAEDQLSIKYENEPVESLLVLFEDKFVHNTYHVFTNTNEHLLAGPFDNAPNKKRLRTLPLAPDKETLSLLNSITNVTACRNELDDMLIYLLAKVAQLENRRSFDVGNVGAIKQSTREELYRRLFIAREYMEDSFAQPMLSLDDIARTAAINKFHFILSFKQVFGITPHQYLTRIRLESAYNLLLSQKYSVKEACYLSGFESLPSFSNLFKKTFGIVPSILTKSKLFLP